MALNAGPVSICTSYSLAQPLLTRKTRKMKMPPDAPEPIAIIGSAHRFPGDANTPSKLWSLLSSPTDVQSPIPTHRFSAPGFYHPDGTHHGTSNVQHSYLLSEDPRSFDAGFFGIKPAEANAIDPQQRLLMETTYESLEAAGIALDQLKGSDTAVYIGLMCADYGDLLMRDPESLPTYTATGTAVSIMSNRISHFFDWHGPSMTSTYRPSSPLPLANPPMGSCTLPNLRPATKQLHSLVPQSIPRVPPAWSQFTMLYRPCVLALAAWPLPGVRICSSGQRCT